MGFAHLGDEEEAMPEKLVEVKDVEISFGEGSKKFVAVHNANFFSSTRVKPFPSLVSLVVVKPLSGVPLIGLNDTS